MWSIMATGFGPWPFLFLSRRPRMNRMPIHKYKPYQAVELPDRTWPSRSITCAPLWCSVDLRDGNQALIDPMTVREKLDVYRLLLEMGFKQIEVGFPSA